LQYYIPIIVWRDQDGQGARKTVCAAQNDFLSSLHSVVEEHVTNDSGISNNNSCSRRWSFALIATRLILGVTWARGVLENDFSNALRTLALYSIFTGNVATIRSQITENTLHVESNIAHSSGKRRRGWARCRAWFGTRRRGRCGARFSTWSRTWSRARW
jgi:hypothetical protein